MRTIATIVAYASGFAFTGYRGSAANLLATSIAVDASLAPLTVIVAMRRGRPPLLWGVLGFVFGLWAFILVLLVGRKSPEAPPSSHFPPTSDAA